MRAVVIEDFNGSIELVRDLDTCDVLVFEDLESAEASKGNYNKAYALALLYLCKKYIEGI